MCSGLRVKYYWIFPILIKLEISRKIFWKNLNIKFHENPSNGSRVVPCRLTDGRTDMRKLIVAFRNFANAPKNVCLYHVLIATVLHRTVIQNVFSRHVDKKLFYYIRLCTKKKKKKEKKTHPLQIINGSSNTCIFYTNVSQPPGSSPVPGLGINYPGPRELLLEFVILVF